MGSLDIDEKLLQMVNDFIEYSISENPVSPHPSPPSNDQNVKHYLLQEILDSGTAAENAVLGCVLKNVRDKSDDDCKYIISGLKKWLVMKLREDGYLGASLCQTSWPTTLGCPGGVHEFIEVVVNEEADDHPKESRLILDLNFKSQFELARPTPSYKELSDKLPLIFVGNAEKLTQIIGVLCSEGKKSFRERGLHIPPWRTRTYMRSKWLANPQRVCLDKTKTTEKEAAQLVINGEPTFSSGLNQLITGLPPKKDFVMGISALTSLLANLSTNCC